MTDLLAPRDQPMASTRTGVSEGGRSAEIHNPAWSPAEQLLAVVGALLIPARLNIWHLVTAGDIFAIATAPLWIGALRRYVNAWLIIGLGLAMIPAAAILSLVATADHDVRLGTFADSASLIVGMLASLGFLLWARGRLPVPAIVVLFGVGALLGISNSAGLYTSNPWRFGFSVPVTILALGLSWAARNRVLDLTVAATLVVVSALTDARSSFAILLLTTILLLWEMRPVARSMPASATRAVLGMGVVGVVVYNLGVVLITSGLLGVQTQQRSLRQIDMSGSLILGGRPEITATLALIRDRVIGFGSGTLPNYHDVMTVKQAMSEINYDPNNGYVENQMLGHGFALHSIFGDLWSQAGIAGLVFTAAVATIVLHQLGHQVAHKTTSGIVIFLSVKTLWNVLFSPWYSSIGVTTLVLVLCLVDRSSPGRESRSGADPVVT